MAYVLGLFILLAIYLGDQGFSICANLMFLLLLVSSVFMWSFGPFESVSFFILHHVYRADGH